MFTHMFTAFFPGQPG